MAEIPNVVPGEPVESDWGNDIRDRVIQKFADATARGLSLPFPIPGAVTWIDNPGQLDVWDGTEWVELVLTPELVAGLALKVDRAGDTMTGALNLPTLIATTRIQGPLEVFYTDVSGVLAVSTFEQTVDTFEVPRTGRYLLNIQAQGNYASLTDADLFSLRIRAASGGALLSLSQTNMFRAWGAPGITTGHFNAAIMFRTGFVGAGTEFDITVARAFNTGGCNLTDLDYSAQNVENI